MCALDARLIGHFSRSFLLVILGAGASVVLPIDAFGTTVYTRPIEIDAAPLQFPTGEQYKANEAYISYSYIVSPSGVVEEPRIEYSNNIPAFEAAVINWLSAKTFEPATLNGDAVPARKTGDRMFKLVGKQRGAELKYKRAYRKALKAIEKGDFESAEEILGRMEAITGRSLYEELRLQTLWMQFFRARGESGDAYKRLVLLRRFMLSDLESDSENRLEEPGFYSGILFEAYRYEVNHLMVADAKMSLDWLEYYYPDAVVTPRAKEHFYGLQNKLAGRVFLTTAEIIPDPFYRNDGVWRSYLSRSSFSLMDVDGVVSGLHLYCSDGEFELDIESHDSWTVPVGWKGCYLEARGTNGTTFSIAQHADEAS